MLDSRMLCYTLYCTLFYSIILYCTVLWYLIWHYHQTTSDYPIMLYYVVTHTNTLHQIMLCHTIRSIELYHVVFLYIFASSQLLHPKMSVASLEPAAHFPSWDAGWSWARWEGFFSKAKAPGFALPNQEGMIVDLLSFRCFALASQAP